MSKRITGVTLVEIVVTVALLAGLGLALLGLLRSGGRSTARSSELQLAAGLGARIVDRIMAAGYRTLAGETGEARPLNMEALAGSSATAPGSGDPERLTVDGVAYSGTYRIKELEPGLLELTVTLDWKRSGLDTPTVSTPITLTRYLGEATMVAATR